jgi:hypothetical protein
MSEDSVKVTKTQTKFENNKLTFKTGYVFDVTRLFPDFPSMNDGQKYVVVYGLKQCGQDFTATEPGEEWTKTTWQAHKLDKLAKGESPSTRKAAVSKETFTLNSMEEGSYAYALAIKSPDALIGLKYMKKTDGTRAVSDERIEVLKLKLADELLETADEDPTAE